MTDALTVALISNDARHHPLANRGGLEMFFRVLAADRVVDGCTRKQREVLRSIRPELRGRVAALVPGDTLVPSSLPPGVHPLTVAALRRKGLIGDDGALTGLGAMTVYWTCRLGEQR